MLCAWCLAGTLWIPQCFPVLLVYATIRSILLVRLPFISMAQAFSKFMQWSSYLPSPVRVFYTVLEVRTLFLYYGVLSRLFDLANVSGSGNKCKELNWFITGHVIRGKEKNYLKKAWGKPFPCAVKVSSCRTSMFWTLLTHRRFKQSVNLNEKHWNMHPLFFTLYRTSHTYLHPVHISVIQLTLHRYYGIALVIF